MFKWQERALDPNSPMTKNNESVRTMSTEHKGKEILFPTIRMIDGELKKLSPEEAKQYALVNNDYKEFVSPNQAEAWSKSFSNLIDSNREEKMNKNPSKNWLQANGPKGHMLAHITPREGKILQYFGGSGTKDKKTGLKSYFLSGLLGGSKPPSPSTSKTELDPEVKKMRQKVFDKAEGVMDQEYSAYDGDRFAGASADTKTAQQGIRDMQGQGQGAYGDAGKVGQAATGYNAQQVGGGDFLGGKGVDQYMNPHTSNVIGGLQDQAMKSMQMGRNQIGASSQMAGAGMGSRAALEKGAMAGEVMSNLNQQTGQLLNQSFADASAQKRADMQMNQDAQKYNQSAGMDAQRLRMAGADQMANMADRSRGATAQDAQMLSQVGADIEGRDQNQKDFDYQQWGEERDWDKNQAMFGSNIVSGAPTGQNVTQNNPMQKGNKLGSALGAGLSGWASTGNPYMGLAMGGASLLG